MPSGVYDRTNQKPKMCSVCGKPGRSDWHGHDKTEKPKRGPYKKDQVAEPDKVIGEPKIVHMGGRDILEWGGKFWIEVAPKAWQVVGDEEEESNDFVTKDRPPAGSRTPMSQRTCSNCGKKGHRSDHCPDNLDTVTEGRDEPMESKKVVHREDVQECKDNGMTSQEAAEKLGVRLAVINKYWI